MTDQLFVTTATWGLDRWEKILNVRREASDGVDIRRARLLTKMSNIPPITHLPQLWNFRFCQLQIFRFPVDEDFRIVADRGRLIDHVVDLRETDDGMERREHICKNHS